jgi:endo-1,4-beta-mannosidase
MKFVVGLVTGFMSGRIFAPEAFVGRDLITDPYVIKWQIKFVKYMVSEFRDHPAISAWDLGNECNNMGRPDKYQAYNWASIITNTIKSIDPDRPVISGMHGTRPEANSVWNICEQSDILDVFCTHPYPLFTPHCDTDPINEMKTVCHATAESLYYGGCAEKPCFIEEAGTLGPFVANETVKANYTRASIFSSWAHNLYGFLWWCANEQSALTKTPYDWNSVERELGLFFLNGEPKPVCRTMGELSEYFDSLFS